MKIENNIPSERFILCGLAQYGSNILEQISDIININCFSEENKYIYKILETGLSQSEKIDITNFISISNDLGYKDILNKKNTQLFIKSLFNTPIIKDNILQYAIKIRKINIISNLQNNLSEAFEKLGQFNGNEDIDDILSIPQQSIDDINCTLGIKSNQPEKIYEEALDYYNYLEENPTEQVGISSGYSYYDMMIGGGFRPKYVNIICARPKAGKSTYAISVAKHVACKLNIPVLYLDTELDKELQLNRMMASETLINYSEIETGKFGSSPKRDLLYKTINSNKDKPLYYIRIAGMPFKDILSIIKKWTNKNVKKNNGILEPCLIIYDYFKLMATSDMSDMREDQAIGFQLSALGDFLGNNNIACLAFVQANREGINKESTDIVAGSDRLVWFCSSLALLRKKSLEEINEEGVDKGNVKLIPMDGMRFSAGLEDGDWINYNSNNFKITELGNHRA